MARTPRAARGRSGQTARRTSRPAALAFDALWVEGALIAPAQLARIAALDAGPDQTMADYGLRKGVQFRDELPLAFASGVQWFAEFSAAPEPSETATLAFTQGLLRDVFGFADLEPRQDVSFAALGGRVPVVVVPPGQKLDAFSPTLSARLGKRTSATLALQDWLNAQDGAVWGIACNGEKLRLLRDNPSLTRPAYIEADLRRIFESSALADFSALWLLIHASRFGKPGTPATECSLERWRDSGQKAGEAARERLRDGVEAALAQLGDGFLRHPANAALREKLSGGAVSLPDFFNQLLRLVYRLIFLLAAEDRGLLHPRDAALAARDLYAKGYSVGRLRERAVRPASWDAHDDLWDGLGILFQALARGEARLGLPALDGLFAPGGTPELEDACLANKALLRAMRGLAWLEGAGAPAPVNWRDMETEELGSVYESLLELAPTLVDGGRGFAFATGEETRGNQRKTTGSYYTPDSLVQALLASALDPVLDRAQAEAADPVAALLDVKVLDPACGSGHFLLAAGRHIAARVARLRSGGTASAEEYRHALREVASACLHGVDRNPMAIELAKVALWIETVEPGKPLGFLDANLRCGDSLLGIFDLKALQAGIPDEAYKPLTGDDAQVARFYAAANRNDKAGQGKLNFGGGDGRFAPLPLAKSWADWRGLPEDSADQVALKRARFVAAQSDRVRFAWGEAADLYVAAFLLPKTGAVPGLGASPMVPTTRDVWRSLSNQQVHPPLVARATEVSRLARAFQWPLEFPDIFARGGFDVVLGNPPWEVQQLNEEEYFTRILPEIAVLAGSHRKRAISQLAIEKPEIFASFEQDKRRFDSFNLFARLSARFPLTANGKLNSYALFAEHFSSLASATGRAGIIVPTGIATDATTAPFFASLIERHRLVRLIDFENRAGIFPAIDSRMKFSLLTVGDTKEDPGFAFFLTDPSQSSDPERCFTLSPGAIARINPNTKTAPVFRSRADASLTAKIYDRVPVLIDESRGEAGNPWGISFRQGLFNMTTDSGLFLTAAQLAQAGFTRAGPDWEKGSARYVPLYEAKMIHQFDHRWAGYGGSGTDSADATAEQKRDPNWEPAPRYWVPETDVAARLAAKGWTRDWLMGWRDITNATNERTVIATVFPRLGVGNNLPLMVFGSKQTARQLACLSGCLSSISLDFAARHKVGGTHLNFFVYQQLPIVPPPFFRPLCESYVVPRVLELTYTSHSLAPFARDLGYDGPPFPWDENRRAQLRAELDAFYARAYGLTRDELRYILDPTEVRGPDYPSETFRVLKENEIRRYGEYRTARLVLEAWDAQSASPAAIGLPENQRP